MKKLIGLLTILLTFTIGVQAQSLGDTKSQVIAERGTPKEVNGDQMIFVTHDRIVLIFSFKSGVVVDYTIVAETSPDAYKRMLNKKAQELGTPKKYGRKGNLLYARWVLSDDTVYILSYDMDKGMSVILVADPTYQNSKL